MTNTMQPVRVSSRKFSFGGGGGGGGEAMGEQSEPGNFLLKPHPVQQIHPLFTSTN